jgi:enoyl-CoA hydratase
VTAIAPERIDAEQSGGCLRLTIDRPAARNALTPAMFADLAAALRGVEVATTRSVVLTGAGEMFSAGADLVAVRSTSPAAVRVALDEVLDALDACPVPTLARIPGPCVGAAVELALACDLRVCSQGAHFALPAARLGIDYPRHGLARYVAVVGVANTRRIALLGERIGSSEAAAMGLVHRVAADLDAAVTEWTDLLDANDAAAVNAMTRTLRTLGAGP